MAVELLRRRALAWTRPAPMHDFADYDAYWQERQGLGGTMRRWELAADAIPDGVSVLDVGCGSGEFLDYLVSRRPNVVPTACDFSDEAIALSKRKGFADSFKLDVANEDIPGKYDYVTCFEVLEHIPNAEDALVRLRAAFRRQLIVSIPNVGYLDSRIRLALFGRFPITNCIYHVKEHVRHWTPHDFVEWTAAFDLCVVMMRSQYASRTRLPVDRFPGLLASGLVYFLEHAGRNAVR